ncbi:MAG: Uma2 family endonuclease [Pseudomonadota bacterium]
MAASAAEVIRPLRRVEYDQLVSLGAFQDERIELLDGALVAMSPIGPPHNSVVQRLTEFFIFALNGRATVFCQGPFAALEFSEPQPDLAIVPRGDYSSAHPREAHLIIEVAESSLDIERGKKLRLYAGCNVPEYWIVNLLEHCIEVYTQPSPGAYGHVERYERGQVIQLLAFSDVRLAVSDVLK